MKNFFSFLHKKHSTLNIKAGQEKIRSLVGNDPYVDWVLIISLTCLLAAILVGVGGYVYVNTQSELNAQGTILPGTKNASQFDAHTLNTVINTFDGRAAERVVLGKGYTGPKDPSLP